jgi:predicted Rossmann-fold nucleotide-binding protein
MGSEYWEGLVEWMREKMLKEYNHISPEDMDVFTVVDEPEAAVKIMVDFRVSEKRGGLDLPSGMKKT